MPDDIFVPDGWKSTTIGQLGHYLNGRAFKTSEWSRTGRPIIRIQDLTGSNKNPNYFNDAIEDRYIIQPGDLLVSWSATLGAYIWDGPEAVLNQHIFKVESSINKKFHYHLMRNSLSELERNAHGSGMVHVTKGIFDSLPVVIPDNEVDQAVIARAIDDVDAKQQACMRYLSASRRAIERLRAVITLSACSGRLTETWRQQHNAEETDEQDGLPHSWRRVHIGDLAASIRGGSTEVPENTPTDFPILRSSSVRPLEIDYSDVRYLSATQSQREANFLQEGDLLITRLSGSVEYVGNCAIVRDLEGRRIQYPDRLFCCRLKGGGSSSADFIELAFAGPEIRQQIESASRSAAGHQRISISDLKNFHISLPPIEEQQEIVRQASRLLSIVEALTKLIDIATRAVEQTAQAVLTKAFRGELMSAGA